MNTTNLETEVATETTSTTPNTNNGVQNNEVKENGFMKRIGVATFALVVIVTLFYKANPFGIFDSEDLKKFKRIVDTKNEITSNVNIKSSEKEVYATKLSNNNTKIEELKVSKKNNELSICGLNKQYGQEKIDISLKCTDSELTEFKKNSTGSGSEKKS